MRSQKLSNYKKPSILIVDDAPENLRYLTQILSTKEYDIRATLDGQIALDVASLIMPDLILLDIQMPKMDGYLVSEALSKTESLQDIPIIFISALDDVEDKIKAFEAGGVDYITKPFEEKEVLARVDAHLQLHHSKLQVEKLLKQQDYFIKKIMHEMNTPLSVIKLNTHSLETQTGENTYTSTIKASVKILASIYDDLGYLIKKEQHNHPRESIKLVEFVSSRIAYFHEIATVKNITIDLEIDDEYTIQINPTELERLVDNTLSNAIKYSNKNTLIEVYIGQENGHFILSVSDQGIGIENTNLIFEQYYQGSNSCNGLGIGMSIVKEICDKNTIKIQIKSSEGIGSVFTYIIDEIVTRVQ